MPRFQRCSTILATLLFAAGTLMAQGNKIEGKVTDENGSAIPFANVLVEGTRLGATANLSGEFVIINVPPGTYTLAASAIGIFFVPAVFYLVERFSKHEVKEGAPSTALPTSSPSQGAADD